MLSHQLNVFFRVVESGSFSKAAEHLLVTPAAVMKHMNSLEGRLGVVLLKRTNQGITLTAAGKVVYEEGKRLSVNAEGILSKALAAEQSESKIIRIGSSLLNPGKVLTDLWSPVRRDHPQFRFRIVPYDDNREQILSVIASLGARIDILVGPFNSAQMRAMANYLKLGEYALCVAVPQNHRLAGRGRLSIRDLYGEHLMTVKSGDREILTAFHDLLRFRHPQIVLEETDSYYGMETFNACERTGSLLLTLDAWKEVHPSLRTIPVDWGFRVPYGILYAKTPGESVTEFLKIIEGRTERSFSPG